MTKNISMSQTDLIVIMILTAMISVIVYENNIVVKSFDYLKT